MFECSMTSIMDSISEFASEMGFEAVINIDNFYDDYSYEVE